MKQLLFNKNNTTTNTDNTVQTKFTTSGYGTATYPNYVYPYSYPVPTSTKKDPSDPDVRSYMDTKFVIYDKDGQPYMLSYGEVYIIEIACSKDKKNRRKFEELSSDEIKDVIMVNSL